MPPIQKNRPTVPKKWLYFGLATIFSSVLLGVMAEISMDLVGHLFGGAAAGKFVATVIGEAAPTGIWKPLPSSWAWV